jgi:hypothetical protein
MTRMWSRCMCTRWVGACHVAAVLLLLGIATPRCTLLTHAHPPRPHTAAAGV